MNLVNEEEEENKNGPTQKERLEKMLNNINKDNEQNEDKNEVEEKNKCEEKNKNKGKNENEEKNENENQPQSKVVLRGVKKIIGKVNTNTNTNQTETKLKIKKAIPDPFDMTFDLEENYFYKTIPEKEWEEITTFLEEYLLKENAEESELISFFNSHPNIKKGNVEILLEKINSLNSEHFSTYQSLLKFVLNQYYQPKPVICECYFFPNASNEEKVVSMLRTCKKTLDISIFSLTLDSIAQAILEAFQRGVKVRIIADDECAKNSGSDIKLIASVGVPCKTDNAIYHMHNKFAVIDNSVVILGSFNWTGQAVKYNQENIFFYEDKNIASQYTKEFEKLWNSFNTVIDPKEAKKAVEDEAKEKEAKQKEKGASQKTNIKSVKEQKIEKSESKRQTNKRVRGVKNK